LDDLEPAFRPEWWQRPNFKTIKRPAGVSRRPKGQSITLKGRPTEKGKPRANTTYRKEAVSSMNSIARHGFRSQQLPSIGAISYIDTVALFIRKPLPYPLFMAVQEQNQIIVNTNNWGSMLTIHQPTDQTLQLLSRYTPSRYDRAYDFYQVDPTPFLVQKWHTQSVITVGNSTFWGRKEKPRNIAAYDDMPSKVNGEPCFHFDLRFMGAKACRRACRKDVVTFADLISLDAWELLTQQTKLMRIDFDGVDKILDLRAGKHKQRGRQLQLRAMGLRDVSQLTSQVLYDHNRGFRSCLEVIPWDCLLVGNSSMKSKAPQKVTNTVTSTIAGVSP
jgi:hypothetical protein